MVETKQPKGTTRIVQVVGGAKTACGHVNGTLFEVAEGPHIGKRACDVCLHGLVGPIWWDRSQVSMYRSGKQMLAEDYYGR